MDDKFKEERGGVLNTDEHLKNRAIKSFQLDLAIRKSLVSQRKVFQRIDCAGSQNALHRDLIEKKENRYIKED